MSVGVAGRGVVGLGGLSLDIFLVVRNLQNATSYINYIAYGFHLRYRIQTAKDMSWKPIILIMSLCHLARKVATIPSI